MNALRLHTHLKRLIVKASTVGLSVKEVHKRIDEILNEYGVRNILPKTLTKKK